MSEDIISSSSDNENNAPEHNGNDHTSCGRLPGAFEPGAPLGVCVMPLDEDGNLDPPSFADELDEIDLLPNIPVSSLNNLSEHFSALSALPNMSYTAEEPSHVKTLIS